MYVFNLKLFSCVFVELHVFKVGGVVLAGGPRLFGPHCTYLAVQTPSAQVAGFQARGFMAAASNSTSVRQQITFHIAMHQRRRLYGLEPNRNVVLPQWLLNWCSKASDLQQRS